MLSRQQTERKERRRERSLKMRENDCGQKGRLARIVGEIDERNARRRDVHLKPGKR